MAENLWKLFLWCDHKGLTQKIGETLYSFLWFVLHGFTLQASWMQVVYKFFLQSLHLALDGFKLNKLKDKNTEITPWCRINDCKNGFCKSMFETFLPVRAWVPVYKNISSPPPFSPSNSFKTFVMCLEWPHYVYKWAKTNFWRTFILDNHHLFIKDCVLSYPRELIVYVSVSASKLCNSGPYQYREP